jgi:choline dehydrogenase
LQHINSASPFDKPLINPRHFSHPADKFFLAKGVEYIRKLADTTALSRHIESEAKPGFGTVPVNAKQEDWEAWVTTQAGTECVARLSSSSCRTRLTTFVFVADTIL